MRRTAHGNLEVANESNDATCSTRIQIRLAHLLLAKGIRLFEHMGNAEIEFEKAGIIESPRVTHSRVRIDREH